MLLTILRSIRSPRVGHTQQRFREAALLRTGALVLRLPSSLGVIGLQTTFAPNGITKRPKGTPICLISVFTIRHHVVNVPATDGIRLFRSHQRDHSAPVSPPFLLLLFGQLSRRYHWFRSDEAQMCHESIEMPDKLRWLPKNYQCGSSTK